MLPPHAEHPKPDPRDTHGSQAGIAPNTTDYLPIPKAWNLSTIILDTGWAKNSEMEDRPLGKYLW